MFSELDFKNRSLPFSQIESKPSNAPEIVRRELADAFVYGVSPLHFFSHLSFLPPYPSVLLN